MQPTSTKARYTVLSTQRAKKLITLKEIVICTILGTVMFATKVLMAALPNIHLVGMFIIVFAFVFRAKALLSIYLYVILEGLFFGFTPWWVPYLYIWTILWGVVMLLPKRMPIKVQCVVFPAICCLHGLFFGALFAPVQALMFGMNFKQTLTWIAAGLSFDILHAVGNLCAGMLAVPLVKALKKIV